MAYNNSDINELIEKALKTNDPKEMSFLVKSPYMGVRRALAKNSNTPSNLVNVLINDPVLNVSYPASIHPRSASSRAFSEDLPVCVTCKIAENQLICNACERKEDHSF